MNLFVLGDSVVCVLDSRGPKQTLLKFPAVVMSFVSRINVYVDAITLKYSPVTHKGFSIDAKFTASLVAPLQPLPHISTTKVHVAGLVLWL